MPKDPVPEQLAIADLKAYGEAFDGETFDWKSVRQYQLLNHCVRSKSGRPPTCGKVLAHARNQITAYRETMGVRICVFKVGITSNPLLRFASYLKLGYSSMWIITKTHSCDEIKMLEAACISHFAVHVGCRNAADSGGEGALNRPNPPDPPYFLYVVGGRADQPRNIG